MIKIIRYKLTNDKKYKFIKKLTNQLTMIQSNLIMIKMIVYDRKQNKLETRVRHFMD